MRKILSFLFVAVLLAGTSCKKSSGNESMLEGKWLLDRWSSKETISGRVYNDGGTYDSGDYIQFEPGGKCLMRIDGDTEVTSYELLDGGKTIRFTDHTDIDAAAEGYQIIKLTNSELEMYSKETDSQSTYEITIYLKK